MTDPEDPPRWSESEGAPSRLGALLRAARGDGPSDRELAQLASKLGPVLKPGPGSGLAPGKSLLAKLGVGAGLAALVAGGWWYARAQRANETPVARSVSSDVAPPISVAPTPVLLPAATPSASAVDSASAAPAPSASAMPIAPASPRPSGSAPRESNGNPDEAALLESARSALASNPGRALALTAEHAKDFPHGILSQEREVIAIAALRRLGRSAEAEKRAEIFDRNYPNSAHQHVVDAVPAK